MDECDVHTLLRLPTGVFYAQGVKANVLFFERKPAMQKAGIAWGGFHRLRHTTATHLIRNGASANEAQLWLGHHDPGFTARTYVHLEPSDLPDPRVFDSLIGTLEESEDADAGAHEPEKPVRASSTA